MKLIPFILVFFGTPFFYAAGFGHVKETIISGRVLNDDSDPVEGATVVVKGTKNITGTMPDGAFSLLVSQKDTVLIISLSGYETKEIKITKETFYEIALRRSNNFSAAILSFHKQAIVRKRPVVSTTGYFFQFI